MKLSKLIDELEDMRDTYGDDVEVRMAEQPNRPLEYTLGAVVDHTPAPDDFVDEAKAVPIVYLVEGRQLGYLPRAVFEAA